jgi:hypothetical protein
LPHYRLIGLVDQGFTVPALALSPNEVGSVAFSTYHGGKA